MEEETLKCYFCHFNAHMFCSMCDTILCTECISKHVVIKSVFGHSIIKYADRKRAHVRTSRSVKLPKKTLKPEAEITFTIKCSFNWLHDIRCQGTDQFWVCGRSSDIICMNLNSEIIRTIAINGDPQRLAIDHKGVLFYVDFKTNSVMKLSGLEDKNLTYSVFSTGVWQPRGVAFTMLNDILVSLYKPNESKVVKYDSVSGNPLHEFQNDRNGKLLFEFPGYIVENKNGDICVSDKHTVICVNPHGLLKFTYHGNRTTSSVKKFDPRGIAVDSQSNIIIADFANNKLHMINSEGVFQRFILSGMLGHPNGLTIDVEDKIWVAEGWASGIVRVIKYWEDESSFFTPSPKADNAFF
ncbi:E3 ubiquitin-protein ligase TRIM71-like [Ostrea edulis]|uniref:E3 ubiquitin-protein ligase TRIM71-like n=1 Tax=Ostrea edulis TaxID=37623 RepID=UPI002095DD0D|nr:E3 ubiquitin-protein ligase TRIM71-like [Ostrea edulis]